MIIKKLTVILAMLLPMLLAASPSLTVFSPSTLSDSIKYNGLDGLNIGELQVYVLGTENPLGRINQELSNYSIEDVEQLALSRLDEYRQALEEYYIPRFLIKKYQLTKLPAIVFNEGEAVIYGDIGLEVALAIYYGWFDDNS